MSLLHGVIIIVVVGEGRDFVCLELRPLWGQLPSSKHRGASWRFSNRGTPVHVFSSVFGEWCNITASILLRFIHRLFLKP
jgi:hypothetical protein